MSILLNQAKVGEKLKITGFEEGANLSSDLVTFGILPGDEIEIISVAPSGSPIAIRHEKAGFMALRKTVAKSIMVQKN